MGFSPAGLVESSDGYIYGMTQNGSAGTSGSAFKIKNDGTGLTKIFDFPAGQERSPGQFIQASDGKFYGAQDNDLVHTR